MFVVFKMLASLLQASRRRIIYRKRVLILLIWVVLYILLTFSCEYFLLKK